MNNDLVTELPNSPVGPVRLTLHTNGTYDLDPLPSLVPQLPMPTEFPSKSYDALIATIGTLDSEFRLLNDGQSSTEWRHFADAANGVTYRWRAVVDADQLFCKLIPLGGPSIEERYQEEAALFAFFANGLSSVEMTCYAMYALAAQFDNLKFPQIAKDPKRITPGFVRERFTNIFPGEALTRALISLLKSGSTYELVRDVRNALAHRGAPGRQLHVTIDFSKPGPPTPFSRRSPWCAREVVQRLDARRQPNAVDPRVARSGPHEGIRSSGIVRDSAACDSQG